MPLLHNVTNVMPHFSKKKKMVVGLARCYGGIYDGVIVPQSWQIIIYLLLKMLEQNCG